VSTWEIVIVAVVVVLALLAIGGAYARRRQLEATQGRFDANLEQVNHDLAVARAEDRGWERATLLDAVRRLYAAERDGADAGEIQLIQVLDRPGTDDDKAVFSVGPDGRERLTLGRRDGQWVLEALE
jgi:hypothetical protein